MRRSHWQTLQIVQPSLSLNELSVLEARCSEGEVVEERRILCAPMQEIEIEESRISPTPLLVRSSRHTHPSSAYCL